MSRAFTKESDTPEALRHWRIVGEEPDAETVKEKSTTSGDERD